MALGASVLGTGATIQGRILTRRSKAVTLDTNTITRSACATAAPAGATTTTPTDATTTTPGGSTSSVEDAALRLKRCCAFAAEWQVTAAGFWANMQIFLGAAAAGLAAISSGSAFSDQNLLAGVLAAAAALAAAVLATLRPAERFDEHKKAAAEYHALAVDVRRFCEFGTVPEDQVEPRDALVSLEQRAVDLARTSPWAPRRLESKTKKLLAKGNRFFDNDGNALDAAASQLPNLDGGQAPWRNRRRGRT